MLHYPPDGARFTDEDVILLQWKPVGSLAPDVYYVPTVAFTHYGDPWVDDTPWIRDTTWTLSDHRYLLDLSDDGVFRWSVRVWLRTGYDPNTGKPIGVPLSAPSLERTLIWKRAGLNP